MRKNTNTAIVRTESSVLDDKVMVELKAVSKLDDIHLAQAINYLEAFKLKENFLR